jgi:hypothetical protein
MENPENGEYIWKGWSLEPGQRAQIQEKEKPPFL